MSVNYSSLFQNLADQKINHLLSSQEQINYRALIDQFKKAMNEVVETCASHYQNLLENMGGTVKQMRSRVEQLTSRNDSLQEQCLQVVAENTELRGKYDLLKVEAEQKEERIQELVKEIDEIRQYMKDLQDLKMDEEVVNFDDSEAAQRFDTLETIKQVSQHDMSVSMSIESLSSFQFENGSATRQFFEDMEGSELQMTPKMGKQLNYEVDNYQDALSILKNYTAGATLVMSRANKIDFTEVKENIPSLIDSNIPEQPMEPKQSRNCTMDKIKKMRRIQSLQLQSGYVIKSEKKPFGIIKQNSQESHQSIRESGVEHRDEVFSRLSYGPESGRTSGRSSISSTRIKSQEIVSLEEPLKNVKVVVEQINSAYQYSHKIEKNSPKICTIDFAGGMHYHGGCDDRDLPSGFGKLSLNGEIIYQGEWRMGKMHGWGKLILLAFSKGKEREIIEVDGNFRGGQVEGTVVCVFNTGQKFMGMIKGGSIEHEGTFVSEKGILTGHWEGSCLVLLI